MLNGVSLLVTSCFKDRIERDFYIAMWPAVINESTTIILSAENHGEFSDMPPRWRPEQIFTVPRLCSAFGRISSVWCLMIYWNRVKPSQGIDIERNRCVWAEHWRRNSHSTKRDTAKLPFSITILGHISQYQSRHSWNRWNRRSYPTPRTLQTLLLLTIVCFDRWHTAWLIIISALMKKSKNGSLQKTHHFFEIVPTIAKKLEKSIV